MDGTPTGFRPSMDREEDQRDGHKDGANSCPHFVCQRRHEGEYTGLLFHWFLDHNADAKFHEWRTKVNDPFTSWRDRNSTQADIRLLQICAAWDQMNAVSINPIFKSLNVLCLRLTRRTSSPIIPSQPPVTLGFSLPYFWSLTRRNSSAFTCREFIELEIFEKDDQRITIDAKFFRYQVHHILAVSFKTVISCQLFIAFRFAHHHVRFLLLNPFKMTDFYSLLI